MHTAHLYTSHRFLGCMQFAEITGPEEEGHIFLYYESEADRKLIL